MGPIPRLEFQYILYHLHWSLPVAQTLQQESSRLVDTWAWSLRRYSCRPEPTKQCAYRARWLRPITYGYAVKLELHDALCYGTFVLDLVSTPSNPSSLFRTSSCRPAPVSIFVPNLPNASSHNPLHPHIDHIALPSSQLPFCIEFRLKTSAMARPPPVSPSHRASAVLWKAPAWHPQLFGLPPANAKCRILLYLCLLSSGLGQLLHAFLLSLEERETTMHQNLVYSTALHCAPAPTNCHVPGGSGLFPLISLSLNVPLPLGSYFSHLSNLVRLVWSMALWMQFKLSGDSWSSISECIWPTLASTPASVNCIFRKSLAEMRRRRTALRKHDRNLVQQ